LDGIDFPNGDKIPDTIHITGTVNPLDKICKKVVSLLEDSEKMRNPNARTLLLQSGFNTRERDEVPRDDKNMHNDLRYMVGHVARELEKLDKLIENAIEIITKPSIKKTDDISTV
jgi:hypothetical protein